MAACECCWEAAQWRAFTLGGIASDHYPTVLNEHAANNCDCNGAGCTDECPEDCMADHQGEE